MQIYHDGEWGSICDDEWDLYEANIACQNLGFVLGAKRPTHSSQYGYSLKRIWMDNLYCYGGEDTISECRLFNLPSTCLRTPKILVFHYYVILYDTDLMVGALTIANKQRLQESNARKTLHQRRRPRLPLHHGPK